MKIYKTQCLGFAISKLQEKTNKQKKKIPTSAKFIYINIKLQAHLSSPSSYTHLSNIKEASPLNVVILCRRLRKLTIYGTCLRMITGFMVSSQDRSHQGRSVCLTSYFILLHADVHWQELLEHGELYRFKIFTQGSCL